MLKRFCAGLLLPVIFACICIGMTLSPEESSENIAAEPKETVVLDLPKMNPNRPVRPEIEIEYETPKETTPEPPEAVQIEPVQTEPPETEPEPTVAETKPQESSDSGWISLGRFKLTAYCSCSKCCGKYANNRPVDESGKPIVYTASGARAKAGVTIAVDPGVIPYGTKVKINGHTYTAQDTGGSINGNRIDVYFDSHQKALNFGVQYAEVFIRG